MRHPLYGATLRIERAIKHFDEFSQVFNSFRESNVDKVIFKDNPGPPQNVNVSFDPASFVVPLDFSLIVSDCIHNLRSARRLSLLSLNSSDSDSARVCILAQLRVSLDCACRTLLGGI